MKETKIRSEIIENAVKYLKNKEQVIKENTQDSLSDLLREKIDKRLKMVMEATEEEDEVGTEDDIESGEDSEFETDFETETEDEESIEDDEFEEEGDEETEMEGEFEFGDEEEETEGEEGNEWSDFDQYKVSDNEYDFTNANEEDVIKVYKLLQDDDQITVKKDDDNIKIVDNENGGEYIVDLNGDGIDADDDEFEDEEEVMEYDEDEITDMVESVLKDFGKHPQYQKEPMTLPSAAKDGKYGTKIGSSDPYDKTVTENFMEDDDMLLDSEPMEDYDLELESAGARTSVTQTRVSKKPQGAIANAKQGRPVRDGGQKLSEAKYKKLYNRVKQLEEQNKQAVQVLKMFKTKLEESVVVNHNLGKIIKLVTEHSTTKKEKIDIIKRFGKFAKTTDQSETLYESINSELSKKGSVVESKHKLDVKLGSGKQKQTIKETKIYESAELKQITGLMKRMDSIKK